jgi:cytochrome P450
MVVLTEMDLPSLPIGRPEFDLDPFPYLEAARRQHPWLAKFELGYFVHGYQAVRDLIAMDDKLRPSFSDVVEFYGAKGTDWGRFMSEHIIAISGPQHTRIRDSIALAFTPRSVNRFRPLMKQRISDLLDQWVPKGRFDFAEFAADFPISILCGVLGSPVEEIPRIRTALEAQGLAFSMKRELLPEFLAGHEIMTAYVDGLVAERENTGPVGEETLLDALIAAKQSGQLSEVELRDVLMVLFPAGYDTSKNSLSFLVYTLIPHLEVWERCAADLEYCARVVEEMQRFSATATPFRTVAEEFDYDGVRFTRGAPLFFGNTIAGRDPSAFPEADVFDPERVSANHHVAFGRGAHICVGQHLARAQIIEGLHIITQRIKNPRVAGEVRWRTFLGTWGPSSLPIEFDTPSGELPATRSSAAKQASSATT